MKTFFKNLILLAALTFATHATAYDFEVDGICYNKNDGDTTVSVTHKNHSSSYSLSVEIPESVTYEEKSYTVTEIDDWAFYGCTNLTGVTIPNTVTRIGYDAFDECAALTDVIIPNSVTTIEGAAFRKCGSLTSITIPASVTAMGDGVFRFCSGLTSVSIENTIIGESQFRYCTGLKSITIPENVQSIGDEAFSNCTGLTRVDIKNSAVSKGEFSGCSNLKNVYMTDNVTSIGEDAFCGCGQLSTMTISGAVASIGNRAFYDCRNLLDIYSKIQDPSVVGLGSDVFRNVVKKCCVLHVPTGTKDDYENHGQWKDFHIVEQDLTGVVVPGDVNGDERVNVSDVAELVNMILGVIDKNEPVADVNGDGRVNVSDVTALINSILGTQGWVDAGTCSILDKTWNEDGQRAEGVPVQHLQGTNQYRMISPLVYLYEGVEDNNNPDDSDFPFMIDEDGKMTVANGFYMDWWGYQMYYDDKYFAYCFVEQENNTYRITFLLQSNSQLYVGGYFEFTWDR